MEFFVPHASDNVEAESVLNSICSFINAQVPEKRIHKVSYTHNGIKMSATVGEDVDQYYKETDSRVIAIIPMGACYAICLPNRGVVRGDPIYVGEGHSTHVKHFD
jgi:hypothetical protein